MSSRNERVDNDREEIYADRKDKKKKRGWREQRHQENRKRELSPRDIYDDDDDMRDFD